MSGTEKATGRVAATVEEDPNAAVVCSSPPCFMHELDPTYLGYLGGEEVAALLAALLAADWGGAVPGEARLRAVLRRRLEAPGGPPDADRGAASSGDPADPNGRRDGGPERLAQAVRGALPRIHDDALRRDLEDVLVALERGGLSCGRVPGGN
jgi:hypothetical protein